MESALEQNLQKLDSLSKQQEELADQNNEGADNNSIERTERDSRRF